MKLIKENIEILLEFSKSYPNDRDLGSQVRSSFRNDSFVMSLPNDSTLGKVIREKINNYSK
jgi:hypothetical protein